jgi:hypothetical protein
VQEAEVTPALVASLKVAHDNLLHGAAKLALHRCNVDGDSHLKARMHVNDARVLLGEIIKEMEHYDND